jgi:hypothetical protein
MEIDDLLENPPVIKCRKVVSINEGLAKKKFRTTDSHTENNTNSPISIYTPSNAINSNDDVPGSYTTHSPVNYEQAVPSIEDFFRDQGIIGEDNNAKLLVYATAAKSNIGIESLAGSGKSALLYALLKAIPEERYLVIHQATASSLFNNPRANEVDFWVIPELQKVFNRDIEDVLKNLTEGIPATYARTSNNRKGVDNISISKKSVLYSFATTNRHMKKRDDEFRRRFIIINTNISKEQNRKVAQYIAQRDFNTIKPTNLQLKSHLEMCLQDDTSVKNPFLPYLIETMPAQITGEIRFRTAIQYFQALVNGCAKYNQRGDFATLNDNLEVLDLYRDILVDNIFGLDVGERACLNLFDKKKKSQDEVQRLFESNYSLPFVDNLNGLIEKDLLSKSGNNLKLKKELDFNVNWNYAFTHADDIMKDEFLNKRDKWFEICKKQLGVTND